MKSAGDFLGDFTYNRPAHVTGRQCGGTSNRDLTCIRRDTSGLQFVMCGTAGHDFYLSNSNLG
jgi:hypothetical protein